MTFLSGKFGKVKIGSTDLNVTEWECTPDCDVLETTHSGSSGHDTNLDGVDRCNGSFKANYDSDAPPIGAPPALIPGTLVAAKLYVGNPADNKYVDLPSVRIKSLPITSVVKGLVSYTCQFESNGAFTLPT